MYVSAVSESFRWPTKRAISAHVRPCRCSSEIRKVSAGLVPAPRCFECARPAQAADAQAEAVRFVELIGDSAEELAAAVAALS